MIAAFLALAFLAGVAAGLWLAVMFRPLEKPQIEEHREEDETKAADWWKPKGWKP